MAKHSYEKARWNRREARKRLQVGKWQLIRSYPRAFLDAPWQFLAGAFAEVKTVRSRHKRRILTWAILAELNQEDTHKLAVLGTQKILSHAAHTGLSEVTRTYRKLWRRRGHQQERWHLLGLHDEAQELDPQPRKLGVMRDIW